MKLVHDVIRNCDRCKICQKIDTKRRRQADQLSKIKRWQADGSKLKASIEKATETVHELDREIYQLNVERQRRAHAFGKGR